MKPHGHYKIRHQRASAALPAYERIVDSLHHEILEGGEDSTLRIRRVFSTPREIFRVELERPGLGYQRTILLGREALESLLERDDIQPALETAALSA